MPRQHSIFPLYLSPPGRRRYICYWLWQQTLHTGHNVGTVWSVAYFRFSWKYKVRYITIFLSFRTEQVWVNSVLNPNMMKHHTKIRPKRLRPKQFMPKQLRKKMTSGRNNLRPKQPVTGKSRGPNQTHPCGQCNLREFHYSNFVIIIFWDWMRKISRKYKM